MPNEEQIKDLLKQITEQDKDILMKMIINDRQKKNDNEDLNKLSNNHRCPYCQSKN